MKDQLHTARLIKESLHDESFLRRNRAESAIRVREIIGDLLRGFWRQLPFGHKPIANVSAFAEQLFDLAAKTGDRLRKFRRARRRFTEPERNSGRLAFCVFDPDDARVPTQN